MTAFSSPAHREVDLPSIDSGVAVNNRLQVGMSVAYYHAHAPGGDAGSAWKASWHNRAAPATLPDR